MNNFIGMFDSGIGGLTVLSEVQKIAPSCDFMYLADHAFCPYGIKNLSVIRSRVLTICNFFVRQGAAAIVVACNTASIFATEARLMSDVPVFDVVSSTLATILQRIRSRANAVADFSKIALLATSATVRSGIYQRALAKFGIATQTYCCDEFVPVAERNASHIEKAEAVRKCLKNFPRGSFGFVVLACTHFPLLQSEISQAVKIPIISSSQSVAPFFGKFVSARGSGKTQYFTTGNVEKTAENAFGIKFRHIDIP